MQEKSKQAESAPKTSSHKVELDPLHGASMSGISSVPTFTDKTVVVRLKDETLTVSGQNLEIKSLDVESGKLTIGGRIFALKYSASSTPASLFKRIFK